ncbi:MAG: Gfo/Idh/MocA family oxidoreductase [Chloroflexi bacterium]|nr:Gfo/Idh/MocA family oxidoreductase [Chloroflexota bacterium]
MPLRVGVVGLEPGTHWNGYTAAAKQSPEVELAAVSLRADLATSLRDQLAEWRVPVYHDAATLLERETLDVLALSTVPNGQAGLIVEGLRRGLHVVADKPLVVTREELARVRQALAAHPGLRISMLMTIRGDPVRQAARQLVREGKIGRLAMLHTRRAYAQRREGRAEWFFDEALSGGPWADGAIHGIDEVLWISGLLYQEVVAYDANVSWPEKAWFYDHGQALFRMEQDVTAVVEHHRLAINDSWLSILGTDAKIEIDRRNHGVFVDAQGQRDLAEVIAFPAPRNVFADFVESIVAGRPALVDTDDTLATMEAVFAVRDAARTGRRVRFDE